MCKFLLGTSSPGGLCVVLAALILLILAAACSDDNPSSSDLPQLLLSPPAISESAIENVGSSAYNLIKVDSDPRSRVHYSFSCDAPWINLSNVSGTTSGITRDSFSISYSVDDLPVGTYVDSIIVTSSECSNTPLTIPIAFSIEARLPDLVVQPNLLYFSASTKMDILPPDTFVVVCGADTSANYSCTEPADWIELTGLTKTMPDTIVVNVDPALASTGENADTIWISAVNMLESPQAVVINLTIKLPDLIVSPNNLLFSADSHEETPPPRTFVVTSSDGSGSDYSLDESADWIELSDFSGTMPDTITVSVDPAAISASRNIDTIWVSAANMLESPQPVEISLLIPSWSPSEVSPYSHPIYDVKFVDAVNGWAGGCIVANSRRDGFILGTHDGGETWEVRHSIWSNDSGEFFGISSVETAGSAVWAVGESGIIRRSQNNGLDWQSISSGLADTVVTLEDIEFASDQIGWIVGEGGVILKTTDGGDTWQEQNGGTAANLYSVSFVDESNGWAAGSSFAILRTTDGGNTWTPLTSQFCNHRSVYFADVNNGWVVSTEGGIAHTSDGGNTWDLQQSHVSGWLNSVFFINDSIGWIAGQDGTLLYTDNAGSTWDSQVINTSEWLHTVYFIDDSTGWCAGDAGLIFQTTSGGN